MEDPKYKYIYGPVESWRIGKSLGVDPVSTSVKTCTFDCVYCQVGKTELFPAERELFVSTEELVDELRSLPEIEVDYITFAGNSEPTLAKNLGEMIRAVKIFRQEKIAVITNASLINRKDVQEDLLLADLVEVKLDAFSPESFARVNRPKAGIVWEDILQGMKAFRKIYRGRFVLQVMFVGLNRTYAREMAKLALDIGPDETEINTPLRANPVGALASEPMDEITAIFREVCGDTLKIRSIYESNRKKSQPFCQASTERRRGKEAA
jgi:wyosine [tRNA(Phe)-imidazoG37] synthetase (radical SAM superfamily)